METQIVHSIQGSLHCESANVLKESTNKNTIIIQGVVMRKDHISRNNILYDWSSVIAHHKELIGRPLLYNHLNEGDKAPVGHVIDSWISADGKEWWYKADVNPKSEYAEGILRGDLSNVSIQLIADEAKLESGPDGSSYKRAFVGDLLELSVVPTPGFIDSSIEMALVEAFHGRKENTGAPMRPSIEDEARGNLAYQLFSKDYTELSPEEKAELEKKLGEIKKAFEEDMSTSNVPTATMMPQKKTKERELAEHIVAVLGPENVCKYLDKLFLNTNQ